jgi:phospholipid/cholesterol/gamma-HCH transport system substrate-binding protein
MKVGRDLKVGLFVLAGLLFSVVVIFLIGDERRLFSSSVVFKTKFADVQGLKAGAPIRMGGIDIGHVESVGYGKDPADATVYVSLDIVESEARRIRTDSKVRIVNKGLLGDKMVEITKGQASTMVAPGGEISAEEPDDMLAKATGMAEKADVVMDNLKDISKNFADERLHKDLRESVAALNKVLHQVSDGEGYPQRLLTDKDEADRISRTVASMEQVSTELTTTLRETNAIIRRIQRGPGFAHDVIYGEGPKKEVEKFGNAAEEVALTLKGIRESDSFVHDALYGGKGDGAEALANVTALTGDLRAIVADMRSGKGTVGALLVDPSVYEDLKAVLGNVERNDVLRALVRYSIKQDEKKPPVEVSAPSAGAPAVGTSAKVEAPAPVTAPTEAPRP